MQAINVRRALLYTAALPLGLLMAACTDDPAGPAPSPGAETIAVALDREVEESGLYFGDFWNEGNGNYYFELSDGRLGMLDDGGATVVPLDPGHYILSFDLWGALSADHTRPTLPEGRYTSRKGRGPAGTFDLTNTLAVYNAGEENGMARIVNIRFESGTIDIAHIAEGYDIRAEFLTGDGDRYLFTYAGPATMADWSDDEEWKWEIGEDVTLEPVLVTQALFEEEGSCDNYVLRCFDTRNITADGLHPNEPGTKFQISIRVPQGSDIAGEYTPSATHEAYTFEPGSRMGLFASGTFCERVAHNMKISYCVAERGKVRIDRNGDGTYTFDLDLTTNDGYAVRGRWTSPVEAHKDHAGSNLTDDVACNPTQCSQIVDYGEFYGAGLANYVVFLATETEIVAFDLIADATADGAFPTGRFTVAAETYTAGTLIPGAVGETIAPSCYIRYNPATKQAEAIAPFASGELTVSRSGDRYTFAFEMRDDQAEPKRISGTWSGTLPEFSAPEEASASAVRALRRTAR